MPKIHLGSSFIYKMPPYAWTAETLVHIMQSLKVKSVPGTPLPVSVRVVYAKIFFHESPVVRSAANE